MIFIFFIQFIWKFRIRCIIIRICADNMENFSNTQESIEEMKLFNIILTTCEVTINLSGIIVNFLLLFILLDRIKVKSSINAILSFVAIINLIYCTFYALMNITEAVTNGKILGYQIFGYSTLSLENIQSITSSAALIGFIIKPEMSLKNTHVGVLLICVISLIMPLPLVFFESINEINFIPLEWGWIKINQLIHEILKILLPLISIIAYQIVQKLPKKPFVETKTTRLLNYFVIFQIIFNLPWVLLDSIEILQLYDFNYIIFSYTFVLTYFSFIHQPIICFIFDEEIKSWFLKIINYDKSEVVESQVTSNKVDIESEK